MTTILPLSAANAASTYDGHATSTGETFVDSGEYSHTKSKISWYDAGQGASGTWIKFSGCTFSPRWTGNPEPKVRLRRKKASVLPDETRGEKVYRSCARASSANFGGQPAGTYHFDVIDVDVTLSNVHTLQVATVRADY